MEQPQIMRCPFCEYFICRCPDAELAELVTIKLNRELAIKMVRPWYLIKKREAEIVRAAFQTALDDNEQ